MIPPGPYMPYPRGYPPPPYPGFSYPHPHHYYYYYYYHHHYYNSPYCPESQSPSPNSATTAAAAATGAGAGAGASLKRKRVPTTTTRQKGSSSSRVAAHSVQPPEEKQEEDNAEEEEEGDDDDDAVVIRLTTNTNKDDNSTFRRITLKERVQKLLEFHDRHGHFKIPSQEEQKTSQITMGIAGTTWKQLRAYFNTIRGSVGRSELDEADRTALLERGFVFQKTFQTFDQHLADYIQYRATHDGADVTCGPKKNRFPLSDWVVNVRNGKVKITNEQRAQLNAVGFNWTSKKDRFERDWKTRWNELVEYKERFGDTCVPSEWPEHKALSGWVHTQRKLYAKSVLRPDRQQALDEIGFVWHGGGNGGNVVGTKDDTTGGTGGGGGRRQLGQPQLGPSAAKRPRQRKAPSEDTKLETEDDETKNDEEEDATESEIEDYAQDGENDETEEEEEDDEDEDDDEGHHYSKALILKSPLSVGVFVSRSPPRSRRSDDSRFPLSSNHSYDMAMELVAEQGGVGSDDDDNDDDDAYDTENEDHYDLRAYLK